MSIQFKNDVFYLNTPHTSYIFAVRGGNLLHLYYGAKIGGEVDAAACIPAPLLRAWAADAEGLDFIDSSVTMEYSTYGSCDYREPGIHIHHADGSRVSKFEYVGHSIVPGKPAIDGLPSAYVEADSEADTLTVELCDKLKNITLLLSYTAYNTCDIITKSVRVINNSAEKCRIERILSSCFDMKNDDYDMITLSGRWAKECQINRTPLFYGCSAVDSKRGASSHYHNPSFALVGKNTDENIGEAYGFSLVYSGNFRAAAEVDENGCVRTMLGINDFDFGWELEPGSAFNAPEAVLTFSNEGIGGMSRCFNKFVRTRMCRGQFRDERRPVLINNWEATYFDFNEEKILSIAEKAKEVGVELMVLDDGWFGKRNSDNCSLGDWYVNRDKLPNGIDGLAKKINNIGLKFGLWFEPEMVSPDSDLYRAHPDWCIHVPGRSRSQARRQLVLDLSRKDVCDYIIGFLTDNLENANIEYVKWDMNRSMTELGSALLAAENQQELCHRYMLGLYRILDTVMKRFPNVLFEGCSGGGGRFDLGMLCYFPQIWTSDDSDAIERLSIQYGTSMIYPVSSMGAHVSAVPNHQVHRITPIETRGNIAIMGAFGYELDLNTLSDDELAEVGKQIQFSKKYGRIIHQSDLYRLQSPFESNFGAFEFVSEDKETVILIRANILGEPNSALYNIRLKGLDDNAVYKNEATGEEYRGDFLENIGLFFANDKGDFASDLTVFTRI